MTQTTADADREQRYAEKIAKLLELANNPSTGPAEAENALTRASELMERYAISEAAIAKVRGLEVADTIVKDRITYSGIYHRVLFDVGDAVARAQGCKTLIVMGKKLTGLTLVGYSKDVERTRLLDASVQIQVTRALAQWWKTYGDTSWMSAMQKFKAKRQFIQSFAAGLDAKLKAAQEQGRADAADDVASATGVSALEATTSTELVLRSREEKIQDWVDSVYGTSLRRVTRRMAPGSGSAHAAGYAAGQRADVGGTAVGGSRRELS